MSRAESDALAARARAVLDGVLAAPTLAELEAHLSRRPEVVGTWLEARW